MPARSPETCPQVVAIGEMARMCQLSRSRFYELIANGIMPAAVYDLRTRRPMYTVDLQADCLRVRSSNIGINGKFILFYARRPTSTVPPARRTRTTVVDSAQERIGELVETLLSLGLAEIREPEVLVAVRHCFPSGTSGLNEGDIIRTLFRHLQNPNRGDIAAT